MITNYSKANIGPKLIFPEKLTEIGMTFMEIDTAFWAYYVLRVVRWSKSINFSISR